MALHLYNPNACLSWAYILSDQLTKQRNFIKGKNTKDYNWKIIYVEYIMST